MINFYAWLNEISSVDSQFSSPSYTSRKASKLSPDFNKFNVIPVDLGYDTYVVFKKYCSKDPKFRDSNNLLDRRGAREDLKTVLASNGEIFNLKELANYIITYSNNTEEFEVANNTLKTISKLEQNLASK
jgi:hypothetical protein